jgi:hypothetical protein
MKCDRNGGRMGISSEIENMINSYMMGIFPHNIKKMHRSQELIFLDLK